MSENHKMESPWVRIVGIVLLVGGAFPAYLAAQHYLTDRQVIAASHEVVATVSGFDTFKHYEGARTELAPVLTYMHGDSTYTYHTNNFDFSPWLEKGEQVTVYVNQDDTNKVLLDVFQVRWLSIFVQSGIAFVLLVFGVVLIVVKFEDVK